MSPLFLLLLLCRKSSRQLLSFVSFYPALFGNRKNSIPGNTLAFMRPSDGRLVVRGRSTRCIRDRLPTASCLGYSF